MRYARRVLLCSVLSVTAASASSLEQMFDAINAYGNASGPALVRGQTMNTYSAGSLFLRAPRGQSALAAAAAPNWAAGCGGIDLFAGSFSFINKEQFVALLRNIGQNSLGYAFKLALQNLCPTCDNVMQALEASA